MTIRSLLVVAGGLGLMLTTAPLQAHHAFAAEYDSNQPITFTGTVTKVEWLNPHARIYVDVKDDKGKVTNWDCELGPPNGLMRRGWRRDSLKPGHVVTVSGFRSRLSPVGANARTVKLPDGRQVFAGSSFDTGAVPEEGEKK